MLKGVDSLLLGVLALQGNFVEHIQKLNKLNIEAIEVRTPEELAKVNGLIIPGGESLPIQKLLIVNKLRKPLEEAIKKGLPVFGTCAGSILLSKKVIGTKVFSFGAIDVSIERNAYGTQQDSFKKTIQGNGFSGHKAVFIRAPKIQKTGKNVKILATLGENPVLCEQGNILIATFHPEMTDDNSFHKYFVEKCRAFKNRN